MADLVDTDLVSRSIQAILKFLEKKTAVEGKTDVLDAGESIFVNFTMFKVPEKVSPKPKRIAIPHSIHRESEICLIVKDPAKTVKQQLEEKPIECITKVIGLGKVKKQYSRFADRRALCSSYDLFLADDSLVPMLASSLGKEFFRAKKMPVPVRVSPKGLHAQLNKAIDSTYLILGWGPCCTVRAANSGMTKEEILANVLSVIKETAAAIPKKWKNIQSIQVKSHSSTSLPVFNRLPQVEAESAPAVVAGEEEAEKEEKAVEEPPKKRLRCSARTAKATKKAVEEEEEAPKKKEKEKTPKKKKTPKPKRAKRTRKLISSNAT